jgi:multidrug efflux system outer membrane protein
VELTRARLMAGIAPRTDLAQAETLLQQARSDTAQLTTQVAQDRNALDLLVGRPTTDGELPGGIEELDGKLAETPAGLDSRILLRRPDVLQAEHQLRAANAEIGAVRAAFFPTISLTSLAGAASPELAGLLRRGNFAWQAQAQGSLPIFEGGANVGNLQAANARRRAALASYQNAVQSAFRDVADALARHGTIQAQVTAQEAEVAAANSNYDLTVARYRHGVDPYLFALIAERTLYVAQQNLAQTRLVRAQNLIALYDSLGGDPLLAAAPADVRD